jgi:hypothetical protein
MARSELAESMAEQARLCEKQGSPLYGSLLQLAAQDVASADPCWSFLEPFAFEPPRTLVPLRFLALFHQLALAGILPDLARHYPTCGGRSDPESAWRCIRSALEGQASVWQDRMPRSVQTNEVGRSCALAPGFVLTAHRTALPLCLLEIGCSAGLNLRWDHYCYEISDRTCGDVDSPVVFRNRFTRGMPWNSQSIQVAERRGCDLNPIALDEDGRLRLLSFVWPDQVERFQLLSNAFQVADSFPAILNCADAVDWSAEQLSKKRPGVATVLFHSIV